MAIQISTAIASRVVNQTVVTHAITHHHQSDMLKGLNPLVSMYMRLSMNVFVYI